jgi:ATP-binding cassette subfamily B protein
VTAALRQRRFLVPEVVQTSAMDCGPATLKCALEGFGISVHYGRLREACQTDVDGTSIDVLESLAGQFGLQAEQVMLPTNHLLLHEAEALPAILVTCLPNGLTHFVLVWRRLGPLVQIMDPAVGRRWITCQRLMEEAYVHTQQIPAQAWHEWALSDGFRKPLTRRLRDLGLGRAGEVLIERAAAAPDWRALARLDAATRLAESLVRARGLKSGREVARLLNMLVETTRTETAGPAFAIPEAYWSVRPSPVEPTAVAPDAEEYVQLRGAVLVSLRGSASADSHEWEAGPEENPDSLSPELAAARAEPAARPGRTVFRLLGNSGWLACLLVALGITIAAASSVAEAVLLRAVIDIGRELGLVQQRLQAIGIVLALAGAVLLVELRVAGGLLRLGRHLESRLRMAFLKKIPRLHDRYFSSRPISDMAERSHAIYQIRLLPRLLGQFSRTALALLITAAAIAWIDPDSILPALLAAGTAIALPLAFNPLLAEMDLRVRTHSGALSRFYLDALLGLAAVRAHGAERAVRREHESLLVEWVRASQRLLRWVVVVEGLQIVAGFGLAGWLVLLHASHFSDAGGALLLAYWALSLPVLGEEIALLARQYPMQRNVMLRLLEPLGALEANAADESQPGKRLVEEQPEISGAGIARAANGQGPGPVDAPQNDLRQGVALTLTGVTVRAAGQTILQDVDLQIDAGSQIAIVGGSGAGKSSLVGLLLGWHRAAAGQILIDGEPLDAARLDRLRHETAWVDPAIQIWNRSLLHNLLYGTPAESEQAVAEVLFEADLYRVLLRMRDGLQTLLGEGGGLLSGGEGQRIRLGRSMLRRPARLVILDEPFRGLDRAKRQELLRRARQWWQGATLLFITHDVGETRDFQRVLVIDKGRVVENDSPALLADNPRSRYRALLEAEDAVREGLWSSDVWGRLWLAEGRLTEVKPGVRP